MIIDLEHFIETERPFWVEFEHILDKMEKDPYSQLTVEQVSRFHYLYQRTSSDLGRITTFASEKETQKFLGSLVARAYGQIHETRDTPHRFRPFKWFLEVFPQTFRRHIRAFYMSLAVTLAGCLFGGFVVAADPSSKEIILPFPHLLGHPSERVMEEEQAGSNDNLSGRKAGGAAWYMTHNTKVSIGTAAMGVTWGIGTLLLLLYNGIILGAVCVDYALAGETKFLVAWLLPHGSVEIPAIILAGQAGFVIAGAIIGWGKRISFRDRLRQVSGDIVTIVFGFAVFLVWAGIIESFLSQYHEPTLPYSFKIGFGLVQLVLVILLFARCGRKTEKQ